MYYVIYVGGGKEKDVDACIRNVVMRRKARSFLEDDGEESIQGNCSACFYPVRHMRKKLRGKWTDYYEKLIPGYVFVESDNMTELYRELVRLPFLTKILGKEGKKDTGEFIAFQALSDRDVQWLKLMMGGNPEIEAVEQEPIVELSQVSFDENDKVVIVSGPLTHMKGYVKKIDLHRRIAEVEVQFMGRKLSIFLGIEILAKEPAKQ